MRSFVGVVIGALLLSCCTVLCADEKFSDREIIAIYERLTLVNDSDEELLGYVSDMVMTTSPEREQLWKKIFSGLSFLLHGENNDAIETFTSLEDKYSNEPLDDVVRLFIANQKTIALTRAMRYTEALPIASNIINRFRDSDDADIRRQISLTYIQKATIEDSWGMVDPAIDTIKQLLDKYETTSDPFELKNVVDGLKVFSWIIEDVEDSSDEQQSLMQFYLDVYEKIVTQYKQTRSKDTASHIIHLSRTTTRILILTGAMAEAVDKCRKIVGIFEDSNDLQIKRAVAQAMYAIGFMQINNDEAEIEAYSRLIEKYYDDDDPDIVDSVAQGLLSKGILLRRRGDAQGARAAYDAIMSLKKRTGYSSIDGTANHARALIR